MFLCIDKIYLHMSMNSMLKVQLYTSLSYLTAVLRCVVLVIALYQSNAWFAVRLKN